MSPIEHAFAPDVHVTRQQDGKEDQNLHEAGPAQVAQGHRERVEERDFDVEQQEDHRDEVELDGMTLAGIADRRHAAFVRGELLGSRLSGPDEVRGNDVERPEPGPEADHYKDRHPTVHVGPAQQTGL